MDRNQIEGVLRLQNAAYELLLWVNSRAEQDQDILSDRNLADWRFAEPCETWVRNHLGVMPTALRPSEPEIPAFARLFSSFFQTSFRLVESAPQRVYDDRGDETWAGSGQRKLMPGAPGGKKSAKGKANVRNAVRELRLIALEALAMENDLLLDRPALEAVERNTTLDDALTLWTYFHELDRRANFASQGEAVRSLWQSMERGERTMLNADKVIAARNALLVELQSDPTGT